MEKARKRQDLVVCERPVIFDADPYLGTGIQRPGSPYSA